MIEGFTQTVEVPAYVLLGLFAYRGEGKELYEMAKGKVAKRRGGTTKSAHEQP